MNVFHNFRRELSPTICSARLSVQHVGEYEIPKEWFMDKGLWVSGFRQDIKTALYYEGYISFSCLLMIRNIREQKRVLWWNIDKQWKPTPIPTSCKKQKLVLKDEQSIQTDTSIFQEEGFHIRIQQR